MMVESRKISQKHRINFILGFCYGLQNSYSSEQGLFESIQLSTVFKMPMVCVLDLFFIQIFH